jgi:hypothetical protein
MPWRRLDTLKEVFFGPYVRGGKSVVYVYLRESDGTPYYIGVGSTTDRPKSRHHATKPPRDLRLVRPLRGQLTKQQAWEWEKYYIKHYGRKDIGTGILRNQSDGGEGNLGYKHTPETKQRVSMQFRGRKQSPEWVEKRISQIRGENNGMYGRKHSPEARRQMSLSRTGRKRGPLSEETRRKISEAKKGKPSGLKGSKRTEEQKKVMSIAKLESHRIARQARADARGVTVEVLLKLEKRERNQRAYANWKAKQAEQA